MPEFMDVTEMLAAQGERKLNALRENLVSEIQRLGGELKIVDAAIARKKRAKSQAAGSSPAIAKPRTSTASGPPADGLSRKELYQHVVSMGEPQVTPAAVQAYVAARGIVKTVEAIRTGLGRLAKDGLLIRENGHFVVPGVDDSTNGVAGPLWGDDTARGNPHEVPRVTSG